MSDPDISFDPRIWSAGPQRVQGIDSEGKMFEIDFNFFDRLGGSEFIDCSDRENRFALV